jgi:metal-responsive CopG/Arc/MetJ family transcriptional regulator
MKTAISIPDSLFEAAERLARRLGMSRSGLYRVALAEYLESHDAAATTDQLNCVYASEDESRLDSVLERLQWASLDREKW